MTRTTPVSLMVGYPMANTWYGLQACTIWRR